MDEMTLHPRRALPRHVDGVTGMFRKVAIPLRRLIGAGLIFAALGSVLAGCAFMFPGLDYGNPFDEATGTEPGDKAEIARSALLKRVTLRSTPIEKARQVLRDFGAECVRETNGGGYVCVYKNLWTGTYFILAVVHRVWYYTYRIHLAEAAGKLDDLSVEVEQKTVDQ